MRWLLAILLLVFTTTLSTPSKVVYRGVTDIECKAWVLSDESRGEPLKGQRAVLDVVETRMKVRKQTACEVVTSFGQFSGYHEGVFKSITEDTLTKYNLVSSMKPVVPGAEYFHASYVKPVWRLQMQKVKQINKHIFYKTKEKHK